MFKDKITKLLEDKRINVFLIVLILLNLTVFIFDTDICFHNHFSRQILFFEKFSIIIFTIEYVLRLCTLKHVKGLFKPLMIVDFIAILPFYLSFMSVNTIFLRVLRLFRLFRLFKLTRYTDACENIKRSFLNKKDELLVTSCLFLFGIVISSILIYYAENQTGQATFKSIPSSFWWSVITFTSVGYGDACPMTTIGKVIASFVAIMGVGLHGLLVGLIGSAFVEALQKQPQTKAKLDDEIILQNDRVVRNDENTVTNLASQAFK